MAFSTSGLTSLGPGPINMRLLVCNFSNETTEDRRFSMFVILEIALTKISNCSAYILPKVKVIVVPSSGFDSMLILPP